MACRESTIDLVFVGLTKIFGPAYTTSTRTMRISRMIPMIMPAPKPPSLGAGAGVLMFVCPMRACSPLRATAVFVRSARHKQAGCQESSERAGELRWREEVRGGLPPLIDQGAARTREERGEGIGWLPARRGDDDDPSRLELLRVSRSQVARESVRDSSDQLPEAALVLPRIPRPLAGHACRASLVARDDGDLLRQDI